MRAQALLVVAVVVMSGCAAQSVATAPPAPTASEVASAVASPSPEPSLPTPSPTFETEALRQDMLSDLYTIELGYSFVCVVMKSVRDKEVPVASLAGLDSNLLPVAEAVTRIDNLTQSPKGWLTAIDRTKDVADTARNFLLEAGLAIGAQRTKGDAFALGLLPEAIGECDLLYQRTKAAREAIDAVP